MQASYSSSVIKQQKSRAIRETRKEDWIWLRQTLPSQAEGTRLCRSVAPLFRRGSFGITHGTGMVVANVWRSIFELESRSPTRHELRTYKACRVGAVQGRPSLFWDSRCAFLPAHSALARLYRFVI